MIFLDKDPKEVAAEYGLPLTMNCGSCKAVIEMNQVFRTKTTKIGLTNKEEKCKCGTTSPFCGVWPEDFLTNQSPNGPQRRERMDYRQEVLRNCPNFTSDDILTKLSLGGLGTAGEAGEVADLIKKVLHHNVAFETVKEKLIKEMGDVYWYLEYLGASIGVTTEDVLKTNVAKLRLRHPNGWTPQSQQAKADEQTYNTEHSEIINAITGDDGSGFRL